MKLSLLFLTLICVTFSQDKPRIIKEVLGTHYLSSESLKEKLIDLVDKEVSRKEFLEVRHYIQAENRRAIKISISPIDSVYARIEVERNGDGYRMRGRETGYHYINSSSDLSITLQDTDNSEFILTAYYENSQRYLGLFFGLQYDYFYSHGKSFKISSGLVDHTMMNIGVIYGFSGNIHSDSRFTWLHKTSFSNSPQLEFAENLDGLSILALEYKTYSHNIKYAYTSETDVEIKGNPYFSALNKSYANSQLIEYRYSSLDNKEMPMKGLFTDFKFKYSTYDDNGLTNSTVTDETKRKSYLNRSYLLVPIGKDLSLMAGNSVFYDQLSMTKTDDVNYLYMKSQFGIRLLGSDESLTEFSASYHQKLFEQNGYTDKQSTLAIEIKHYFSDWLGMSFTHYIDKDYSHLRYNARGNQYRGSLLTFELNFGTFN